MYERAGQVKGHLPAMEEEEELVVSLLLLGANTHTHVLLGRCSRLGLVDPLQINRTSASACNSSRPRTCTPLVRSRRSPGSELEEVSEGV